MKMATFAAKYLVPGAASGVTGRVGEFSGDLGKQLSMENLTKKDLERAEKELIKEDRDRKKKHHMMEASRERLRSDIRRKYGIQKRRAHQPVDIHAGILMPKSQKDLERVEKELDKEERDRKKKHLMMEASRERLRSVIREKYGIQKRRAHQPVETHTGILTPKREKELLLAAEKEEEEDDDCTCIPCSCTWASLCSPFLSKNTKHS